MLLLLLLMMMIIRRKLAILLCFHSSRLTALVYVITQRDQHCRSTTNMARLRLSTLSLAFVFVLCHIVDARSRRFGVVAKTLHMPPLTEAEKWGKKFVVMHADDFLKHITGEDPADDVDKFLRRFRRSASDDDNATIEETAAPLNDSHSMLVVHWAGESSSIIMALAKSGSHSSSQSSKVYLSQDYGKTFRNITNHIFGDSRQGVIDKYYNSDILNSHYVFTEQDRKCVFTTRDFAGTFTRHCGLTFTPKVVSLSPFNVNHILVYDPDASNSPVHVSEDFGLTWRLMREDVKAFFWGVGPYDAENTVYIEEKRGSGGSAVLRSNLYFANGHEERVISNIEDFEVREEYMFATKKQHLFGSHDANGTLQFWVSYKRQDFVNAQFPVQHGHTDYYVADASEGQVMLCVVHNTSDTHLYISDIEGSRFSLSLEHIVYFNPKGAHKDTWLSYYYNESFADIHKVMGLRGIYIASQLISANGSFSVQNQRSLITFDKGGEWNLLSPPAEVHGRPTRNCTKKNCSLHLSQEFLRLYPGSQAQPVMSRPSAPGLILGSGTVGNSLKSQQDMFVSHDAGYTWYQVMDGNYMFAMADHGGIILAARQFQLTDTVYYSADEGRTWRSFRFTNSSVRIYGILTEPGERTTVFSVFGSKPDRHSWILFQLNASSLLGRKCITSDYKDWSLPDEVPDAGCLLGQKLVFQRRIPETICYNGESFVRMKDLRNCSCTRDDFECDFGYQLSEDNVNSSCIRDEAIDDSRVHSVPSPCPPGTFYSYTRGYRRVSGDTCSGGDQHRYAPRMFSCPVQERSEFILVAGRDRIQAIEVEHFNATDLYRVPFGVRGHISAVAFDYARNQLFWSSYQPSVIQSLLLNNDANRTINTLANGRLQQVTSLAYDWTGDNLYWTDEAAMTIEMMRSNGFYRKRLISNHSRVTRPTHLKLDPIHGWMYWLEVTSGHNSVMRAWMNGDRSSIQVLPLASQYAFPQGLALDIVHEQLYVTTSFPYRITRMALDGSNATQLELPSRAVQSPGTIAVFKEELLWINGGGWQLMNTATQIEDAVLVLKNFNFTVIDMMVISHISQSGKGACTPPTSPCSQLCASRPHPADASQQNRTCLCGDEFHVESHPTGDQQCSCENPGEVIQGNFCQLNGTGHNCSADQFKCKQGRCIPSSWRCDRDDDCGDMSDETDCPYSTCPSTAFTCDSGKCIPSRWHCDYDNDCGNNKDEEGCEYRNCTQYEFRCDNQRCVPTRYVCDMDNDCRDGSDERNCTNLVPCHSWEFRCSNGECISQNRKCNGVNDCGVGDDSDERNCSSTCSAGYRKCNNGHCIYRSWFCDGDNDCGDSSDEANCTTTPPPTSPTVNRTCHLDEFSCNNGYCISLSSLCDGFDDCGDYSDEEYCDYYIWTTTRPPCQESEFACNSGQCIPLHQRCDNHTGDCRDHSDEIGCFSANCAEGEFECYDSSGSRDDRCIRGSWQCDGVTDCPQGEDERYCNITAACPFTHFRCLESGECIPHTQQCDGKRDCFDGSDESDCQVKCDNYTKKADCCQNGCIFLDCLGDGVRGCFSDDTSIGSSCSKDHNNLCKNATVTPPGDYDSAFFYHCPYSGNFIPRLYVCNQQSECSFGEEENSCDPDLTSEIIEFKTLSTNSTTALLYWYFNQVYSSTSLVSYFPKDQVNLWRNLTVRNSNTVELHHLIPNTRYVAAVYMVVGDLTHYPSTPIEFTTLPGSPSAARHLRFSTDLQDGTGAVTISWDPPATPNGRDIYYSIEVKDLNSSMLYSRMTTDLHIQFLGLTEGHTFQFTVTSMNGANFTGPNVSKVFLFQDDALRPLSITATSTETSVTLHWPKRDGAVQYLATASLPHQLDRRIHGITTDITYTFKNLCPGTQFYFTVEVDYGNNRMSLPPNPPLSVKTKGTQPPVPSDLHVTVEDATRVIVNFTMPAGSDKVTVYYLEDQQHDLETFFQKAHTVVTSEPLITLDRLNACERYFFRVGCGANSCPVSAAQVIHTQEDDKGPPKHLHKEFVYVENQMSVKLYWSPPCESVKKNISYIVEVAWPGRPQGERDLLPGNLSYVWKNVTRGETYNFTIRTNLSGSRRSRPLVVPIPRYPAPEGLILRKEADHNIFITWPKPQELPPPNAFMGYNVTLWRDMEMVDSRIVKDTRLYHSVKDGRYTVMISTAVKDGPNGEPLKKIFTYYLDEPDSDAVVKLTKTNLVAILVPVCLVLVALVVVIMVFVVRHRRLQRSFLAFANSHYNTRSGTTTFSSDLDDDEPMIQGFSDDEPLVLA